MFSDGMLLLVAAKRMSSGFSIVKNGRSCIVYCHAGSSDRAAITDRMRSFVFHHINFEAAWAKEHHAEPRVPLGVEVNKISYVDNDSGLSSL